MLKKTERNRIRKFVKLVRRFAVSLPCCQYDDPKDDMTVELAVELGFVKDANYDLKDALKNLLFAYQNKDADCQHDFEISAVAEAEKILTRKERTHD